MMDVKPHKSEKNMKSYSLFPGGAGAKIHMVDYENGISIYIIDHVNFWPPPVGAQKIGIKCAIVHFFCNRLYYVLC